MTRVHNFVVNSAIFGFVKNPSSLLHLLANITAITDYVAVAILQITFNCYY